MATLEELEAAIAAKQQAQTGVSLEQLDAAIAAREPAAPQETSFLEKLVGGAEGALSLVSGTVAEPVAGILGLAAASNPFGREGAGARVVSAVKDALTFKPGTPEGKAAIGQLGETLQPIVEPIQKFQKFIGDDAFKATGSEELAAIMTALPAAFLELIPAKKLIPTRSPAVQKFQLTANAADKVKAVKDIEKNASKALVQAAPSTEQLKTAATTVYKQIDEIGVQVKPQVFSNFTTKISEQLRKQAFDPDLHPLVAKAVQKISEVDGSIPTTEIGILREFAQGAVKSTTPKEARLGRILKNELDDLLTNLKPGQVVGGDVQGLGQLYQKAGELWRRSIKSETVGDLFDNAELRNQNNQVGFKDSIKSEFLSIIKKNRKTKQFTPEEITEMRKVVDEGKAGSLLSLVGRLDLTQQQKANALVGVSSFGSALAVGGPLGFGVPVIGFVSRSLADRLVRGKSEFAEAVVKAGSDGQQIAREYIKRVPAKQRDSLELTELLINRDVDLNAIKSTNPIVLEAVQNAKIFTPTELAIAFGLVPPQLDFSIHKEPTQQEQQ